MKTIVLAFFASASLTAWGQLYKVAGTVLDAKSKVPVEFATLWIEGSTSVRDNELYLKAL